jgi:hypothetical protein
MRIKFNIIGQSMSSLIVPVQSMEHAKTVLLSYGLDVPSPVLNYFLEQKGEFLTLLDEHYFNELHKFYNDVADERSKQDYDA